MIRTDNGTEFAAKFRDLISSLGIKVIKITPSNSRANGQAERMICTLKSVIRKYLTAYPWSYWTDILPYALIALRMTTAASHKMPLFTLVVGRHPMLPSHINLADSQYPSEPTGEEELGYAALVIRETEKLRAEA